MLGPLKGSSALLASVFPFPLVRLTGGRLDAAASAVLLVSLALTRLLLLPRGPWEQDEALLASGVLDFDPAHHMPLPPGFPLWVLLGRLVRLCGVADALSALQVASAVLSVLGVWALVGLWSGVAGRVEAVTGAVLAAFIPGVWFHAARAFSETAAATFAIVGVALWLRKGNVGFVPGAAALACAALVRPPLAPLFVVAVLLAAWGVRRDPRRLVVAAGVCLGLVVIVLAPLVVEAGGPAMFLKAMTVHGGEHLGLLGTQSWHLPGIGFVRGLATVSWAAVFASLAAIGWLSMRRPLGWRFWAGTALGLWLFYLLLFLHNRTYPRYWVLAWLLLATPAVVGVRTLLRSATATAAVGVVAAAAAALWTWPAVLHLHANALPVVAALDTVAAEGSGTLVFEDQLFSFRNLWAKEGKLRGGSLRVSEIPPRRLSVGGNPLWFLTESEGMDVPSNASQAIAFACREPRVARLSQERFLRARLVRNPVLAWRGASVPEVDSIQRFIWCEGRSLIVVPPVAGGGAISLACEIHPALGEVEVSVRVAGSEVLRGRRPSGRQVIQVPLPPLPARNRLRQIVPLVLEIDREVRLPGDLRRLAVRLFNVSVEAPPYTARSYSFFPEEISLVAAAAASSGTYPPEALGNPPRPAAWTGPVATFSMPVGAGLVGVDLLAPRATPARVTVRLGTATTTVDVGPGGGRAVLGVLPEIAARRRATLVVESSTFVPGGGDQRELGVAISRVWYASGS